MAETPQEVAVSRTIEMRVHYPSGTYRVAYEEVDPAEPDGLMKRWRFVSAAPEGVLTPLPPPAFYPDGRPIPGAGQEVFMPPPDPGSPGPEKSQSDLHGLNAPGSFVQPAPPE